MKLDYEKLFEPYAKDGNTIENSFKYLKSEAVRCRISLDIMELSISETFTEIAGGKRFSTVECSCGCRMRKAGTDLTHSIRDRMINIDKDVSIKTQRILNERYNTAILGHIKRINQDYINSQMPYKPWKENILSRYYKFMNFKRSPILKLFRRK